MNARQYIRKHYPRTTWKTLSIEEVKDFLLHDKDIDEEERRKILYELLAMENKVIHPIVRNIPTIIMLAIGSWLIIIVIILIIRAIFV